MNEITIERNAVNIEALDADLRAALSATVLGVSTGPYGVYVHLTDAVTSQQQNQARQIVQTHDPSRLTATQQAALDQAAKLNQARQGYGVTELDLTAFDSQPALIQKLAQKIAWLEQEIVTLRANQ